VDGDDLADLLQRLWGQRSPATWNRNRAAVAGWLSWCTRNRLPAPALPARCERRREAANATRAVSRSAIERALSRRDVPLREKTLWRLLYESAARANEILALNIENLDLDARRAPIRSKGGDIEWIHWGSGTAHLLPRLIRGRDTSPVFLSERRPGPTRRPGAAELCPTVPTARVNSSGMLAVSDSGIDGCTRSASGSTARICASVCWRPRCDRSRSTAVRSVADDAARRVAHGSAHQRPTTASATAIAGASPAGNHANHGGDSATSNRATTGANTARTSTGTITRRGRGAGRGEAYPHLGPLGPALGSSGTNDR
jgi:hypothetical protein